MTESCSQVHPQSLSRKERDEKPFSLRDKGTLGAEQKGWDEGGFFILLRALSVPGAKSSLGFPATVTRPGFAACLNCL